MTRVACVHCFTIDASSRERMSEILADLQGKINAASARLDIGYEPGFISGQLQPERQAPPTPDPERLFDD
jgi:hypothetical protein